MMRFVVAISSEVGVLDSLRCSLKIQPDIQGQWCCGCGLPIDRNIRIDECCLPLEK